MKKVLLVVMLAVSVMLCGISMAEAAEIDVTVSLATEISVSLDKATWTIGSIALNGTSGPETFVATVGNVATKLDIKGDNGDGGWTIGTPAADTFQVAVTDPVLTLTAVAQELSASVEAYGSKSFILTYTAPSSDTKGAGIDQSFGITVTAGAVE